MTHELVGHSLPFIMPASGQKITSKLELIASNTENVLGPKLDVILKIDFL